MSEIATMEDFLKELKETECPDFSVAVRRGLYKNDLNDPSLIDLTPVPNGYLAAYYPLQVSDDEIPEVMKNIGIQISLKVEDAFVEYDEKEKKCVYRNKNGEEITPRSFETTASVYKTDIHVFRTRLIFSEEDYMHLTDLHERVKKVRDLGKTTKERNKLEDKFLKTLSDKDRAMYKAFVCDEKNKSGIKNTIIHEMHHVFNRLVTEHRPYASDYKDLTTKEKYKRAVENERTATLAPLVSACNTFLKKGDFEDFSPFEGELDWVIDKIEGKTDDEIRALMFPPHKLMNNCLSDWNYDFQDTYFDQFRSRTRSACLENCWVEVDKSEKEYKKQRSMMYTFQVYNPYTKKDEFMDLSPMIEANVLISDKDKKEIIEEGNNLRAAKKCSYLEALEKFGYDFDYDGYILKQKRAKVADYLANADGTGLEQMRLQPEQAIPSSEYVSDLDMAKMRIRQGRKKLVRMVLRPVAIGVRNTYREVKKVARSEPVQNIAALLERKR